MGSNRAEVVRMRSSNTIRAGLVAFGVAGAVLVGAPAGAQEVFFAGSTAGAFNGARVGASAPFQGLTYQSSTFAGTTSSGFLGIGNEPGTPNFNNLGSIALS